MTKKNFLKLLLAFHLFQAGNSELVDLGFFLLPRRWKRPPRGPRTMMDLLCEKTLETLRHLLLEHLFDWELGKRKTGRGVSRFAQGVDAQD